LAPALRDGVVDVWSVRDAAAPDSWLSGLPDAGERERAARFASRDTGAAWLTTHAILRALLGTYLDADPRGLRFRTGAHGKPALAGPGAHVRFNLSHTDGIALLAFAIGWELGVDVERSSRRLGAIVVSRRVFGAQTADELARLPPAQRDREFLRLWVRHEAALKCAGVGLGGASGGMGLGRPGGPGVGSAPEPWITDLDAGEDAAAALAVAVRPAAVRMLEWPGQLAGPDARPW